MGDKLTVDKGLAACKKILIRRSYTAEPGNQVITGDKN